MTTLTLEKNPGILFFKKKIEALMYKNEQNLINKNLFSQDVSEEGAKCFLLGRYENIYEQINNNTLHNIYENIEMDQRVKLHLDIDLKNELDDVDNLRLFRKLIPKSINLINSYLKEYGIENPKTLILRSKNLSKKISGHIIYPDVIFESIMHMKYFIWCVVKSDLIDKNIIDKNIYRVGCFRVYGCSKYNRNNHLIYSGGINYRATDPKEIFMDSLVTNVSNLEYVEMERYNKTPKEKSQGNIVKVNIKDLVTTNRKVVRNYIYIIENKDIKKIKRMLNKLTKDHCENYCQWISMTYCLADLSRNSENEDNGEIIYDLWEKWCKKSKRYNKVSNDDIFEKISLDFIDGNYLPIITNNKHRFRKVLRSEILDNKFSSYNVETINTKDLSDLLKDSIKETFMNNDVIIFKAGTGTGKTTLGRTMLSDWNKGIISISSRCTMSKKHADDFCLTLYKDCEKSGCRLRYDDCKRLSIVLNSLLKISEDNYEGGVVLLDEISKLHEYFRSCLLNKNRGKIFSIYYKLIKNASKVIMLDADLTEIDVKTIMEIRKPRRYKFYKNVHKNREGVKATFYKSSDFLIENLIKDYVNDISFVACFDSLTKMKDVTIEMEKRKKAHYEELKKTNPALEESKKQLILYSSEHTDKEKEINTEDWENNYAMYTSIVTFSISYVSDTKTRVYAFGFNKILTPFEINQQIQRTRNQLDVNIYVTNSCSQIIHNSVEELDKDIANRVNNFYENIAEIKPIPENADSEKKKNKLIEQNRLYKNLFLNTTFKEETSKSYYPYYLKYILNEMGYEILEDNEDDTGFVLENNKELYKQEKMSILDNIVKNKEVINKQLSESFIKRLEILRLEPKNMNDFSKELIVDSSKFMNHINLRYYLCSDINDKLKEIMLNDFDENIVNNIHCKLGYFALVMKELNIKHGLIFNSEKDIENFKKPITNEKIIKHFEIIVKTFRFGKKNIKELKKPGGYLILYKLALNMCRHLFGHEIIKIKKTTKKIDDTVKLISKQNLNLKFLKSNINLLPNNKILRINDELCKSLKISKESIHELIEKELNIIRNRRIELIE